MKESSGGNWLPILLPSNAAYRTAIPPSAESDSQKAELRELLDLQGRRTGSIDSAIFFWNGKSVVRWNEIARDLVAKHRTSHPMASRVYALLSVAQYDASVAAWNNKYFYKRKEPSAASSALTPLVNQPGDPVYPSDHAAIASASACVLEYLFPDETDYLASRVEEDGNSRLWAGVDFRSDITAGDSLGLAVGAVVVQHARADRSDAVWNGSLAAEVGRWFSAPNDTPLLPLWGKVKPWLLDSGAQIRAAPPPPYGSDKFKEGLNEVRKFSDTRTPEQARIAALWADGPGSYSPAGRWNKIASDLILKHGLTEIRAARALALLNMAMMDAGIACWDTKYHYAVIRPSQADSAITTPVGLPNFPSYVSGHSSFSGAGSEVLGYLFPTEKDSLRAKAWEASMSRIYGGIHYRFDAEEGLAIGRKVADLAIKHGRSDGSP